MSRLNPYLKRTRVSAVLRNAMLASRCAFKFTQLIGVRGHVPARKEKTGARERRKGWGGARVSNRVCKPGGGPDNPGLFPHRGTRGHRGGTRVLAQRHNMGSSAGRPGLRRSVIVRIAAPPLPETGNVTVVTALPAMPWTMRASWLIDTISSEPILKGPVGRRSRNSRVEPSSIHR